MLWSKTCGTCGKVFWPPRPNISRKQWEERNYCSRACWYGRRGKGYIVADNGCWIWQGSSANAKGYCRPSVNGKNRNIHRMFYELAFGSIKQDKQIHHTCHNPKCVNPGHLIAMNAKEHSREHLQTYCKNGHERIESNLMANRRCRLCHKEASRQWRRRQGAKERVLKRERV